jgi:aspartate/methionine/tyrosine aminotransferase
MPDTLSAHDSRPTHKLAAAKRSAIDPFVVMDIMREANARDVAGGDIVHMEVGQPGTPAPRLVREAVKRAMEEGPLGYTDALGLPELRERIARYYRDVYGLDVSASRVVVTTGSSAGFVLAFLTLLDAGDKLVLPQPGYPCYRQIAKVLGIEPVFVPARRESGFMPSVEAIAGALAQSKARAVLLASPANPTGSMLLPGHVAQLAHTCKSAGAWFISDEIYHGLTYTHPGETALAASQNAIAINSFSKYFSMTGWRIGWVVMPESLIRTVERIAQNLYISAPTISQVAAIAAFEATEELEDYKAVYVRNRDLLLAELPKAGFRLFAPADGAFYLYCDISDRTDDSDAFVRRMLAEAGVAATPGVDFDPAEGRHFMRFSYAGRFDRMREAMRRLQAWRG